MKKVFIAMALVATTGMVQAATEVNDTTVVTTVVTTIVNEDQEKTPVKAEELPEAVKNALAADVYAGTTFKQAFFVKAEKSYYEIELAKEDASTIIVKLDENGAEVK